MSTRTTFFFIAAILCSLSAMAVSPPPETTRFEITELDAIVLGTVLSKQSIPHERFNIVTVYEILIDDLVLAWEALDRVLYLVELGGQIGDEIVFATGTPRLEINHQYLFPLRYVVDDLRVLERGADPPQFMLSWFGRTTVQEVVFENGQFIVRPVRSEQKLTQFQTDHAGLKPTKNHATLQDQLDEIQRLLRASEHLETE